MQAPPLHALQAGDKLTMTFAKNPKPSFLQHHQPGGAGAQVPQAGQGHPGAMDPKQMLLAALAAHRR